EQTGWAAPVAKREGNPFPDRVSIGRAPNCDIVLRLPYVSKLHAHVVRDADGWSLTDNQSANGTWINEVELPAGVRRQIQPGDWIRVGALHLEVVDGPSLYQRLPLPAASAVGHRTPPPT
ncbi:MAG: FHA domain-containing protein, partial [Myxococcota bacterium]